MKTLILGILGTMILAGCGAASDMGDSAGPTVKTSAATSDSSGADSRWEECMEQYGELAQEVIVASGRRGEFPPRGQEWGYEISDSTDLLGHGRTSEATALACGVVEEMQDWLSEGD